MLSSPDPRILGTRVGALPRLQVSASRQESTLLPGSSKGYCPLASRLPWAGPLRVQGEPGALTQSASTSRPTQVGSLCCWANSAMLQATMGDGHGASPAECCLGGPGGLPVSLTENHAAQILSSRLACSHEWPPLELYFIQRTCASNTMPPHPLLLRCGLPGHPQSTPLS